MGRGRKLSLPNLRYYVGICVEGLGKSPKTLIRIAGLRTQRLQSISISPVSTVGMASFSSHSVYHFL
jgi:hypothetical protein